MHEVRRETNGQNALQQILRAQNGRKEPRLKSWIGGLKWWSLRPIDIILESDIPMLGHKEKLNMDAIYTLQIQYMKF